MDSPLARLAEVLGPATAFILIMVSGDIAFCLELLEAAGWDWKSPADDL